MYYCSALRLHAVKPSVLGSGFKGVEDIIRFGNISSPRNLGFYSFGFCKGSGKKASGVRVYCCGFQGFEIYGVLGST